jgi:hypothetical protein
VTRDPSPALAVGWGDTGAGTVRGTAVPEGRAINMRTMGVTSWVGLLAVIAAGLAGRGWPAPARAGGLRAVPFEFVGKAGECARAIRPAPGS